MRDMWGITGIRGISGRLRSTSAPVTPPFESVPVPALEGLIPENAATFDVSTDWIVPTDVTITAGQAVRSSGTGNRDLEFPRTSFLTPLAIGRSYNFFVDADATAGTATPRWTAPDFQSYSGSISGKRRAFMPFPSTALHDEAAVRMNSAFRGALNEVQVYDITDKLAGPLDIHITAGQSNQVGASAETGFDEAASTEPRALVISGLANAGYGRLTDGTGPTINDDLDASYGVGVPTPIADPVMHSSINFFGVSPVTAMATAICDSGTEAGRTPAFVAAGDGGSSLYLEWDPDSTATNGAIAWDLMIAQVEYLLSLNVENRVRGMFWCQGESDRSVDPSGYAPAFNSRIDLLRARPGWGDFPVVIMEIGGPIPDTNTEAMIAEQKKLATGSGDAAELTNCVYVERPTNWAPLEDDTLDVHFRAPVNVQRGKDAAAALIGLLGGSVPADAVTFDGEPVTFDGEYVTFTPA